MAITDVVKWDSMQDFLVWKYPNSELATWSQLIVNESQEALFIKDGKLANVFEPGKHTLDTENYPFIKELFSIPFGGKSPFTAEIWFINKTSVMNIKWGTAQPVELQDTRYGIIVPLTAYGQFGVKIRDSATFYKNLVGSNPSFRVDQLKTYLKGVVYSLVKSSIAGSVIRVGKSPFELNSYLGEIGDSIKNDIQGDAGKLGIEVVNFYISGIHLPENNPEVNRLRSALAKKAEMDIIGYTYHDEQSFETMKNAINKGKSLPGGILETGMELGMGIKMAKGLGGTISQIVDPLVDGNVKQNCIVCGKQVEKDSKFCRHCGAVQEILCPGCGKVYKEMIKFCSECGSSLEAKEEPSNENA